MKQNKKLEKFTPEELADAIVFPVTLTESEEAIARTELAEARKKSQKQLTDADKIELDILQLKLQLEHYLVKEKFDARYSFGHFLSRYIDVLRVKRKEFAGYISIDESLLSQFINNHRNPPDYIAVRLELHSNKRIPAVYWYRLVEKQREHALQTDQEMRKRQKKFVRNVVRAD